MPKLTSDLLKNCLPDGSARLELRDDLTPGLIFRVTPAGQRSWSFRYRSASGEQRRQTLGSYPAIGLAEARRLASIARGDVSSGGDPVQRRRVERREAEIQRLQTFGALAAAYFADARDGLHRPEATPKRPATLKEEERVFEAHIRGALGERALAEITRAEIQAFVTKQSRAAGSRGRICRNVIRQVLAYAEWKELIAYNPGMKVAAPKPTARTTVIPDADLRLIWKACSEPSDFQGLDLSKEMGLALRFALVTLQRGQEVVGMKSTEVDYKAKTWLIPGARMKNKRDHLVPLSDLAIGLLRLSGVTEEGREFVFQSDRGAKELPAPLTRHALSRAMARLVTVLEVAKATPHDFRRTGATNLTSERVSIPRFVVSKILAHSSDDGGAATVTGRHYDLYDYLPEKRRAMSAWSDLLVEIVGA